MINIYKILEDNLPDSMSRILDTLPDSKVNIKDAMLEFGKQLLEVAAERSLIYDGDYCLDMTFDENMRKIIVDKESITEVLTKYVE